MTAVLACVDGLNDYDTDFTTAAVSGADMKTAYEVGRGMVRRITEAEPANSPEALAGETDVSPASTTASPGLAADESEREPAVAFEAERGPEDVPAPRRMRFVFAPGSEEAST